MCPSSILKHTGMLRHTHGIHKSKTGKLLSPTTVQPSQLLPRVITDAKSPLLCSALPAFWDHT